MICGSQKRETLTKSLLLLLPALCAATIGLAADDEDSAEKRRIPDLVVRADRYDITLGETVRLTSVIPADFPIADKFNSRVYVSIAAEYDPKQDRMVCVSWPDNVRPFLKEKFLGLKAISVSLGHPPRFNVRDPRTKGFERSITPRYLGSYMLTVSWLTGDHLPVPGGMLQSQPIIITVRPPKDEHGRPNVKPEWLPTVANLEGVAQGDAEDFPDDHTTDDSETLSPEEAAKLAREPRAIFLGATTLTPEVARVLTTRSNNELPVYLSGITALEGPDAVAVAEALARSPAPVVMKHLQRISAPALAALRKKPTITIPPDEKLTIVP